MSVRTNRRGEGREDEWERGGRTSRRGGRCWGRVGEEGVGEGLVRMEGDGGKSRRRGVKERRRGGEWGRGNEGGDKAIGREGV